MKLNVANFVSATILSAQSIAGLQAQETKPAEDLTTFPMQFSIVYPMTTQGDKTVDYRYHCSFNLFSGKVGAVTGIEFGSLFNHAVWDVTGVQCAGLANRTLDLTGVQFGGLGNIAKTVKGVQFAGLANISKSVTGIQYGGLVSISDSIRGIQFSGIANLCQKATNLQFGGIANMSGYTKGAQFAGIVNLTEKSEGAQFAGIANISKEVSGASFSGVLNRTGTLRGCQLGLVNVIDTIESGVSIALINIVKKGFYDEWALTFADYLNAGLSYKMGTQRFYTIFTAGANFMDDRLWVFGIGFGNRTPLGRRFDFQPEIVTYQYFPENFKNVDYVSANHLKFGFVYKLNKRFGITVAPSLYFLNNEESENNRTISPISPFFEYKTGSSNSDPSFKIHRHSFGAGISIGLALW